MASYWITLTIFAALFQTVFPATVVINRGDNANNDNDETLTTQPPNDPPIQHQFAFVSSRLAPPKPQQPVEAAQPGKVKDTDDTENSVDGAEEANEESQAEGRGLYGATGKKRGKQGPVFQQAVGCGYYRMRAGQAISIQSTNFNSGGTYRNFEQCTWKFFGQQCRVKASCPYFDLPSSRDCIGDYLKVTDQFSFAHKFCGDLKPLGTYNSTTQNLKVHFRADGQRSEGGEGFLCCVTCTGPGKLDPPQLLNATACSLPRTRNQVLSTKI